MAKSTPLFVGLDVHKDSILELQDMIREIGLNNIEPILADAVKRQLEIDPTFGEELEKLAKEVVGQPPEVVARMRQMLGK